MCRAISRNRDCRTNFISFMLHCSAHARQPSTLEFVQHILQFNSGSFSAPFLYTPVGPVCLGEAGGEDPLGKKEGPPSLRQGVAGGEQLPPGCWENFFPGGANLEGRGFPLLLDGGQGASVIRIFSWRGWPFPLTPVEGGGIRFQPAARAGPLKGPGRHATPLCCGARGASGWVIPALCKPGRRSWPPALCGMPPPSEPSCLPRGPGLVAGGSRALAVWTAVRSRLRSEA